MVEQKNCIAPLQQGQRSCASKPVFLLGILPVCVCPGMSVSVHVAIFHEFSSHARHPGTGNKNSSSTVSTKAGRNQITPLNTVVSRTFPAIPATI